MSGTQDISVIGSPHASAVMGLVAAQFGHVDPSDNSAVEEFFATLSSLDPEVQAAVVDEVERLSLASEIDPGFHSGDDSASEEPASRSRMESWTHRTDVPSPKSQNSAHAAPSLGSRPDVDFALVVGVDHYPRFRSLHWAVEDATRFHTWLCEADGGGIAAERARLVVSRSSQTALSQDQVDEQLLELLTAADARGGGRRLYFYFAGHGTASPRKQGEDIALLLPNWSSSLARCALSVNAYRSALSQMGLFEEIAFMFDCPRTTAGAAVGRPPTITHRPQIRPFETRTFIAYATEAEAATFERHDQQGGHGAFTSLLLSILHRSPHGISASDLASAFARESASGGQRAHVVSDLREDSVIGRQKMVITFVQARGRVRLRSGDHSIIAERDAGAEPWELSLEEGLYKLEDGTGRSTVFDHAGEAVTRVAL